MKIQILNYIIWKMSAIKVKITRTPSIALPFFIFGWRLMNRYSCLASQKFGSFLLLYSSFFRLGWGGPSSYCSQLIVICTRKTTTDEWMNHNYIFNPYTVSNYIRSHRLYCYRYYHRHWCFLDFLFLAPSLSRTNSLANRISFVTSSSEASPLPANRTRPKSSSKKT